MPIQPLKEEHFSFKKILRNGSRIGRIPGTVSTAFHVPLRNK
jgi:hypothetical protein